MGKASLLELRRCSKTALTSGIRMWASHLRWTRVRRSKLGGSLFLWLISDLYLYGFSVFFPFFKQNNLLSVSKLWVRGVFGYLWLRPSTYLIPPGNPTFAHLYTEPSFNPQREHAKLGNTQNVFIHLARKKLFLAISYRYCCTIKLYLIIGVIKVGNHIQINYALPS